MDILELHYTHTLTAEHNYSIPLMSAYVVFVISAFIRVQLLRNAHIFAGFCGREINTVHNKR